MRSSVLRVVCYNGSGKLFCMYLRAGDTVPPSGDGWCVSSSGVLHDGRIVLNFTIACDFADQRHPADHRPDS